jgi:hypothetical protein
MGKGLYSIQCRNEKRFVSRTGIFLFEYDIAHNAKKCYHVPVVLLRFCFCDEIRSSFFRVPLCRNGIVPGEWMQSPNPGRQDQ